MSLTCPVGARSLTEACLEGDVNAVRKLLKEGWSVHEPTDDGESLLSLACSAGTVCRHWTGNNHCFSLACVCTCILGCIPLGK